MIIDRIDLREHEEGLLKALNINALSPKYPEWTEEKGEASSQLISLLLDRGGIPEIRKAYFSNPEFNTGRTKDSRQDVFINNGHTDESMMQHPHFLDYARYFIFGARLSTEIKKSFVQAVEECGDVTSGDYKTLINVARKLLRQSNLNKPEFREEIYKLAIDCGLEEYGARHIRQYM